MSLVGFRARNHPQQTALPILSERRRMVDDRATTPEVSAPLHERFRFTVDVAASDDNAKTPRYYDLETDGLVQCWAGERVWCNPPYSAIRPWIEKAWSEPDALVVMLVPANRTEQSWWQDLIEPHRDRGGRLTTEFFRGRLRFLAPGADKIGANERPPFGCVLLIFAAASPSPETDER